MDNSLYLTDIIEKTGLPKDEVAAVRHSLNHEYAKRAWDAGIEYFEEYQRLQPLGYFDGKKYIFSFVNGPGTTARFIGLYELKDVYPVAKAIPMKGFPLYSDYKKKDLYYYDLQRMDLLEDLRNRLVIEWWKGTNNIVHHKWATLSKKPVLSIDDYSDDEFPGYSKVIWSFSKMARLVNDPIKYPDVYQALTKVNGVYLVLDPIDNMQYIGSAYGPEGIYGRWKTYAQTEGKGGKDEDGANKKLSAHLNKHKNRYLDLQYCILDIIHRTGNVKKDKDAALALESEYKLKLGTRNEITGLNLN